MIYTLHTNKHEHTHTTALSLGFTYDFALYAIISYNGFTASSCDGEKRRGRLSSAPTCSQHNRRLSLSWIIFIYLAKKLFSHFSRANISTQQQHQQQQ